MNVTTVVAVNSSFSDLKKLNLLCRQSNTRLVAANVFGGCGLVFNDFLSQFSVSDADGENYKEVNMTSTTRVLVNYYLVAGASGQHCACTFI